MIAGLTSYTSYHRFVSIYSHYCGYFILILSVIQDNYVSSRSILFYFLPVLFSEKLLQKVTDDKRGVVEPGDVVCM